jgi:hypothetical protein
VLKGPKSNLEIATIGAKLEDFDFEVGLNVVGFNLSNRPRNCSCTGDKLNAQCKAVSKRRSSYYFRNKTKLGVLFITKNSSVILKYNNK